MALAASRNGQRVLLHGASGDLAMQAPHYYPALSIRNFRLRQAWLECRAASRNHVFLRSQPPARIMRRSLLRAVTPPAALNLLHAARRRRIASVVGSSLIDPGFAASIHLRERLQEQFSGSRPLRRADERLARFKSNLLMVRSGLSGYGRVAARFGVETRDPWADCRVLDFFYRLPVRHLVRDGWTKHLVRSSFARELPPEVRWRRDKGHLGWKFALRLMTEMNDKVRDLLLEDLAIIGHYAKVEEVRGLYRRYVAQPDDACREDVFSLVSLILWLRRI
jgi:asparagine synthase (glutamine-hydrolysing)